MLSKLLKHLLRGKRADNQDGFSLIELMVLIAILGILATMVGLGMEGWHKSRLATATSDLLADLQAVRMEALTVSNDPNSRGFGIRFLSNSSYKMFEFIGDGDFLYEGDAEESSGKEQFLTNNLSIERNGGDLIDIVSGVDQAVLIYDKRGMGRNYNWGSLANRTYIVRHSKLSNAKCIVISRVRIREGLWDGSTCNAL